MDQLISNVITAAVEQSPALAILSYIAYRLEVRIGDCIEHQKRVIDRLILDREQRDRS